MREYIYIYIYKRKTDREACKSRTNITLKGKKVDEIPYAH